MRITAFALGVLLASLLGGCGASDADPGPGGVTVGEAKALDDAAAMLDQRRLPPAATASATSGEASTTTTTTTAQGETR